jgi:hypothetical protein
MSRATGANAAVLFSQEASWGDISANKAQVYALNLRSETLASSKNLFESEMINAYRATIGLGDGNKAVAGGIVSDLIPEGLEVFFKHLLGNPTIVTTGGPTYKHVIPGSAGFEQGITIEKGFTDIVQYLLYKGCRINSMTLNLVQEGFHDVTFDFLGKTETMGTVSGFAGAVPITATKSGYTGYQCVISTNPLADGDADHYSDLSNVVSGSITINNNIETDGYVLGSVYRASAQYGKRSIEGNLSVFFENATMYNYYIAGTEVGLKFTFTNGLGQILVFEFPTCKLGGESPKIENFQGLNLPLTFRARYVSDALRDVYITITNTIASIPDAPAS